MLTHLTISNFAIVRELEIDFQAGMTAITGETGAGKSIAIDAIGLCLGDRADINMVRPGATRADICASFSLQSTPAARRWLEENQLDLQNECLLRRTIGADGRSRGFINGTAVPLGQLRELGQLLIQIHGQHAHQQLLKPEHQRSLLDAYADHQPLLDEMRTTYQQWRQVCRQLTEFRQQHAEREARCQLLQYQLKELNEFSPQEGEYQQIDCEYKQLANSDQLLSLSQQTLQCLVEEDQQNVLLQLHGARQTLSELVTQHPPLQPLLQMLEEAAIQISEVGEELRHFTDRLEPDPQRLSELEERLSRQLNLARKHHVPPEMLPQLHQQLLAEQQDLTQQQHDSEALEQQAAAAHRRALSIAQQLHKQRSQHADELARQISESLHKLSMPHGQLEIAINFDDQQLAAEGADRVSFSVSTNPGQPLHPLAKVASGGELSRIALAIQVITAQKMDTPALIFDEVDVGISGQTAAIVGQLLRQLGGTCQVICVTHLPQVAGNGHQHFFVSKQTNGEITETLMYPLTKKERLQELARLLGGSEITRNTLANAKELLAA